MKRDRRNRDRRSDRSVQFETRRSHDRRDYPRFDIALDVREPKGRSRSCFGDLSPEGASFITTAPPLGDAVLLRVHLPNVDGPIIAAAKVVARSGLANGTQVSVAFTDIHVDAQLAIAEWAHDRQLQARSMEVGRKVGPKPIPLTRVVARGWKREKTSSAVSTR